MRIIALSLRLNSISRCSNQIFQTYKRMDSELASSVVYRHSKKLVIQRMEIYSASDLIEKRDQVITYLIEQNEIHFTISYFSLRLMFLFIFATIFSLLSRGTGVSLTLILALLSIILFLISRKYREYFILGDMGIKFAETIYSAKINENLLWKFSNSEIRK